MRNRRTKSGKCWDSRSDNGSHLDVAGEQSVEEVHIGFSEVAQVLELLNWSLLEL